MFGSAHRATPRAFQQAVRIIAALGQPQPCSKVVAYQMHSSSAPHHAHTSTGRGSGLSGMSTAFQTALAGSLGLLLGGVTYANYPFPILHQEAAPASQALSLKPKVPLESKTMSATASPKASGPELVKYTREQVSVHRTRETGVWVTYQNGVYDVTKWLDLHPGGAGKIMLAAGGAVDPFWAMYQQHQKAEVKALLAEYKIGELQGSEGPAPVYADPYAAEPSRHPALIPRSNNPCNAETPPSLLTANPITPTDLFYVRNHLPVPTVDVSTYRLHVEGDGMRTVDLTLDALKTIFKKHTITATIQCAVGAMCSYVWTQQQDLACLDVQFFFVCYDVNLSMLSDHVRKITSSRA